MVRPSIAKRYRCTHSGCDKAYTKPSRLEEHERSHTGQRPFVCGTCHKSYLRDSHLQVHIRTHLPQSDRPFVCLEASCMKRFMTAHHLRRHQIIHSGGKPFKCSEENCNEAFTKHYQLREHICSMHAPPGTKSYQCDYVGCTKSFSTSQHLRTHSKVHDDKRYTCVRPECLPSSINSDIPVYFPTWSALQQHNRAVHPPRCNRPSCSGKTFSSQHGLRAHQKLHEQRDAEDMARPDPGTDYDDDDNLGRPQKKRRGGEYGRDWKCEVDGCERAFKSKNALTTHVNVAHLGRRDHTCSYNGCGRAFGYKHLLQRHAAKAHQPESTLNPSTSSSTDEGDDTDSTVSRRDRERKGTTNGGGMDIDAITGNSYAVRARAQVQARAALRCPYPNLGVLLSSSSHGLLVGRSCPCEYVFRRAYDLRRHLKAVHGVEMEKEDVVEWVRGEKEK